MSVLHVHRKRLTSDQSYRNANGWWVRRRVWTCRCGVDRVQMNGFK